MDEAPNRHSAASDLAVDHNRMDALLGALGALGTRAASLPENQANDLCYFRGIGLEDAEAKNKAFLPR